MKFHNRTDIARPQQKAELTRLCHTFLLVPNIHWIIIEDAKSNTNLVHNLLANCGVVYTLINEATPPDQKLSSTDSRHAKPRGVLQRNAGLHWIRQGPLKKWKEHSPQSHFLKFALRGKT